MPVGGSSQNEPVGFHAWRNGLVHTPSMSWPHTVDKDPVDVLVVAAARTCCSAEVDMHGKVEQTHAVDGAELATCRRAAQDERSAAARTGCAGLRCARWLQERASVVEK